MNYDVEIAVELAKDNSKVIAEVNYILSDNYGYHGGVTCAPSIAVLWALESITHIPTAKKALTQINKLRGIAGKVLIDVPYGHDLF